MNSPGKSTSMAKWSALKTYIKTLYRLSSLYVEIYTVWHINIYMYIYIYTYVYIQLEKRGCEFKGQRGGMHERA